VRFVLIVALSMISMPATSTATEGEFIYRGYCLKCHGEKGDGNGHAQMKIKPADLRSDAVQVKSDEDLYRSIAFGVGHKEYAHAFAERGLNRKQIAEVVTFIRKFAKKK
jgi:mono/diheme cytochrome c family protein